MKIPAFEVTPEIAAIMVNSLSQQYNEPFHYMKKKHMANMVIHHFRAEDGKHTVALVPKFRTIHVENYDDNVNRFISLQKAKEIFDNAVAVVNTRPRITDIQGAVAKRQRRELAKGLVGTPLPSDVTRKIGDYVATGKIEGGRRRKTRKMKKTRKNRRI